jgi:CRISPR system Cascade subunit CasA
MTVEPPSFSLIEQPWIPVVDLHGRARLVGLREAYTDAGNLRCVAGDMPTQTFAIVRLLLAILHRAADGPPDAAAWATLWQAQQLPDDVTDYLDHVADRFDLLHPQTPFYQVADLRTDKGGDPPRLEKLIADVPNGDPYLTTRLGGIRYLSFAEAAVWLVHCHAFDSSGIKTGAAGDPRVTKGKGYPIGTGSCGDLGGIYLEGTTLRETLLLNLVPTTFGGRSGDERDLPVWERPPQGAAEEPAASCGPFGPISLYTWQSRRIRLHHTGDHVTGAMIAIGDKLTLANRQRIEAMTAWRRSSAQEKALKLPLVYLPKIHDPTRALWRGMRAILPTRHPATDKDGSPTGIRPILTEWLAHLRNRSLISADAGVTTRAVGVVWGTKQSVIDEIYYDSVTTVAAAFDPDSELGDTIVHAAADADAAVTALRHLAADLVRAAGGSGNDPKDPPVAAAARAAEHGYATLDQHFRGWLADLHADTDPLDARTRWQQSARRVVRRLGQELVEVAGPHAWIGRKVNADTHLTSSLADLRFRRALARALPLAAPQPTAPAARDREEITA